MTKGTPKRKTQTAEDEDDDDDEHEHDSNARLCRDVPDNVGSWTWWIRLRQVAQSLRHGVTDGAKNWRQVAPSCGFLRLFAAFPAFLEIFFCLKFQKPAAQGEAGIRRVPSDIAA